MCIRDRSTQSTWERDLAYVEKELVRTSLCWPKQQLFTICGKGKFQGVPHPHSPSNQRGLLDPEFIAVWANRMYGWIVRLQFFEKGYSRDIPHTILCPTIIF
eukprot:TRINITY_DN12298_c0_g1_i2.p2 TRINITY_DN12298_c0_g1~~TRINITY_DN12298_c0_g1_i2.p2  ORF type:complete len:102 (+),score=4.78 TRINITY_DN12298_c0_g1_i2:100-405(+)